MISNLSAFQRAIQCKSKIEVALQENANIWITLDRIQSPGGENIQLKVRDDGKGIKPEFILVIFNRFSQVDRKIKGLIKKPVNLKYLLDIVHEYCGPSPICQN